MLKLASLKFIEEILVNPLHRIRVYVDAKTGKRFIAKALTQSGASDETREMMIHEYDIASSLEGENHIKAVAIEDPEGDVVVLYEDFGGISGGISLAEILHQGPMGLQFFFQTAIALIEGLENIHLQSVAHQDIKPSNIIVNLRKNEYRYNDFSLAKKWTRQEEKWVAGGRGSVDYISPEQTGRIDAYIDYRTDFYSLGATFYQMLCGRLPFVTTNLADLVHAHIARLPDPPHSIKSSIPEQLSSIILKMLAKSPKNRYKSALGIKKDLIRCFDLWQKNKEISAFPLGEEDKGGTFEISPGFYGRENEFETIKQITRQRERELPLLVLVSGPPGSGKTSFVKELTRKVELNEGYFVHGKFDQYQRHRPLTAMISAFSQLFEKIRAKKGEDAKKWFVEVLGDNLPAITQMIPSLELLMGKQGKAVEVSPSDAQNRFAFNVSKIIELVSSEENPTILFLDDLQWADASSLHLFYSLLTNKNCPGLIVIGAYRDNEVDQTHPLTLTLQKLEQEGGSFEEIAMGSLEPEASIQLISDTLERTDTKVNTLASRLYSKSGGNPLLTRQLLIALYDKELINFDQSQLLWDWKEDEIAKVQIDAHIVDLIINKIDILSEETKKMLFLAASFGDEMELDLLAKVMKLQKSELLAHAEKALGLGIIDLSKKEKGYRLIFCHDRFREACYQIVPIEMVAEEHKNFGIALINLWDEENQQKHIFQITNLLNQATPLLNNQEKIMLANFNLKASAKAIDSFAFKLGLQFIELGIALLPEDAWNTQYSLMFRFHENGIVTSGELKEDEKIREFFDALAKRAKSPLETTKSYVNMIHYLYSLGDFDQSIQLGRSFLNQLDFHFPKKGSKLLVIKEYLVTRILFWWRTRKKQERPKLTDPRVLAIIDVMEAIQTNFYYSDILLFAYGSIKGYHLMLTHGLHHREVSYRISFFYLGRVSFHDFTLSRSILDEINITRYKGFSFFPYLAITYLIGLRKYQPLPIVNQQLEEYFLYSLSMGNVVHSTALYLLLCLHNLSAGLSIYKNKSLIENYEDLTEKVGVLGLKWTSTSTREFYNALISGEEYSVFIDGERRKTDALFTWLESKGMHPQQFHLSFIVLLLALINSKDDTAWIYAQKGNPFQKEALGTSFKEDFYLYEILAIGLCYDKKPKNEQKEMRKICKSNIKELKTLMGLQYENYAYKYWLGRGEYARMKGDFAHAHLHYREGIRLGEENGFLQDTAIALERCSMMVLSLKDDFLAKTYMEQAIKLYDRWGAKAKVVALEQEYEQLFPKEGEKEEKTFVHKMETITSTSTGRISDMIDTQAYINAAEAISEQIELESLMTILVDVVLKNAGAEYVVLLTHKENEWFVTAEKASTVEKVTYSSLPLEDAASKVPLTVIADVIQSKNELVLRDALEDSKYNQDAYVIDSQCRSILCLPLIYQNKMRAVLYLENSLTKGAFTEERVQNVMLLSSHIANALENAFLYEELKEYSKDLENKVEKRTVEIVHKNIALLESNDVLNVTLEKLKKTQKQLIASEKLASLGELTSGIAHEIRNPLNFINNFSTLNINLAEHHRTFFRQLDGKEVNWEGVSEELWGKLGMLEDNQKRILSYGERLSEIVSLMEKHARIGKGEMQLTPISGLVDRSLAATKLAFTARYPDFSLSIDKYYDESIDQVSLIPDEIDFVLSNVIKNALEAMEEKSETDKEYKPHLIIQTERTGDVVGITIKDNGIGIEDENLDNIFNPFYTSKPTGMAVGLALSISHMIVTSIHHGYINVASQHGLFTEVTITLPLSE